MSLNVLSLIGKRHDIHSSSIHSCVFEALLRSKLPDSEKTVNRLKGEGQTLIGAEVARELGVTDRGRDRPSHREMLGSPNAKNPAAVY